MATYCFTRYDPNLTAFLQIHTANLAQIHWTRNVACTRENSTPAYWYALGVQNAMHDSMVIPVTSVNAAVCSVRLLVESLK